MKKNIIVEILLLIAIGVFFTACAHYLPNSKKLHPEIKKYHVISLEVPDILLKADTGIPFSVTLDEKQVKVFLKPTPVFSKNAKIAVHTKEKVVHRRLEGNITYSGYIVGAEKMTWARFTITKDFLIGSIVLDEETWFIEPLRKFRADANKKDYIVYRTKDLQFKIDLRNDTVDKYPENESQKRDESSPNVYRSSSTSAFLSNNASNCVGIVLVADRELLNLFNEINISDFRGAPELYLIALLNDVNGLYEREIGGRFVVTHLIFDSDNSFLTSTDKGTLLLQFENYISNQLGNLRQPGVRRRLNTEIAHLLTGKDLDGSFLGVARLGGHYGLTQISSEETLEYIFPLYYKNMMVMAHELGHNFNAIHEEADEWCDLEIIFCFDYVRSLMWETFYSDNVDEFSDGSRNADHNNKERVINNWANRVRTCEVVSPDKLLIPIINYILE